MLRERSALILKIHKGLDITLTVIAFVSAYFIKLYLMPKSLIGLTTEPSYYVVLLLTIIIWYPCFAYFRLYESYRKQSLPQILLQMIKSVTTGMVLISLALYALKLLNVSRLLLLIFYIINVGLLSVTKSTIYLVLKRYRGRGFNFRNILIIGSKER